jgi:hypothetical protein
VHPLDLLRHLLTNIYSHVYLDPIINILFLSTSSLDKHIRGA